jgi:8-oxo-dGTP diphosphatase
MTQQPIGVAMIILDDSKEKILLGKRKNSYKSGSYGLPGGRLETAETLDECVKRELKEETGLETDNFHFVGVVRELQDSYNFIHFIYTCSKYTGELTNVEPEKCEGWEWHSLHDLPSNILRGHAAAIDMFHSQTQLNLRDLT